MGGRVIGYRGMYGGRHNFSKVPTKIKRLRGMYGGRQGYRVGERKARGKLLKNLF